MKRIRYCTICGIISNPRDMCPKHFSQWWRDTHPGYDAQRARMYRARNPEKKNAINRAYRNKNKEYCQQKTREWIASNKEKYLASALRYRTINKEKVNAGNRAWRKKYPERAKRSDSIKKARRYGALGDYLPAQISGLYKKQDGLCVICRVQLLKNYHVDHIIPLAKGGSNYIENIQLLCPPCNMSKSDKDPIEFMKSKGLLL